MTVYNINVANVINVTFVTYYKIFNCNICNISVEKFIYIQNIEGFEKPLIETSIC